MKFLVIYFNRYNTASSKREYFDAPNVEAVIHQMVVDDEEEKEYMLEQLEKVDEVFSCIAGEESDILFYVI